MVSNGLDQDRHPSILILEMMNHNGDTMLVKEHIHQRHILDPLVRALNFDSIKT